MLIMLWSIIRCNAYIFKEFMKVYSKNSNDFNQNEHWFILQYLI